MLVNDGRSRRDSSWTTVSTEGYGSMKTNNTNSDQHVSRRGSELSAVSQVRSLEVVLRNCPPSFIGSNAHLSDFLFSE